MTKIISLHWRLHEFLLLAIVMSAILYLGKLKIWWSNDELIQITLELTEEMRRSRTIDWQKKKVLEQECASWSNGF